MEMLELLDATKIVIRCYQELLAWFHYIKFYDLI